MAVFLPGSKGYRAGFYVGVLQRSRRLPLYALLVYLLWRFDAWREWPVIWGVGLWLALLIASRAALRWLVRKYVGPAPACPLPPTSR
jgi:hypothetical protein